MPELSAATIRLLARLERDLAHSSIFEWLADQEEWQGSTDSNRGPSVLETDALTN